MVRLIVVLALCACQSKPSRPPSVSDDMAAVMDRDVAVVRKVAAELDAAKTDCKQAAKVIRDNTAEVARAAKESKRYKQIAKDDPAAKAWIAATYKTEQNEAAAAVLRRVAKQCEADPHYQAAMALQHAANLDKP